MANLTGQTLASSYDDLLTKGSGATPIQDGLGVGFFYSEGTWTPSLVGSTTAGDYTVVGASSLEQKWIRIGNMYTLFFAFTITVNSAGTGNAIFGGLPNARKSDTILSGSIELRNIDLTASAVNISPAIDIVGPSSNFVIRQSFDNATSTVLPVTAVVTGSEIRGYIVYYV